MKKVVLLILGFLMVLSVAACSNNDASDATETVETAEDSAADTSGDETVATDESSDEVIHLGACVMNMANEVFVQYAEGYEAFEEACGGKVKITLVDGGGDVATQVEAIENFINLGVDGIMLNALDPSAVEDALNQAMDAGIKVGVYPTMDNVTFNFVFDEYDWGFALGESAGEWINERLDGEATIMCFNQTETEATMQRYYGIVDGVESVVDPSNLTWLETVSTTDTATAMSSMESILQAHPEVQVVFGSSDSSAVGAYQAVISSGLDLENFFIGGCDGISEALQYISEGTVYRVSIANGKLTEEMGFEVLQNLVEAIVELDYQAPYKADVMTVNVDNVDEYLSRQPEYTMHPELAEYLGLN